MNGEQGFFPRSVGNTSSNNNSTGSFVSSGPNVVTGASQYGSTGHEPIASRFGAAFQAQLPMPSRMPPPIHGMAPRMPSQRVMSSHSQQMQMSNPSVMSGMLSQGPLPSRLMQPGGASPINLSPGVQRRPMLSNDGDPQRPLMDSLHHHVPIDRSIQCGSHYFNSKTPEEFRKMQESGSLDKPPWYLVPPVPDHLRGPSSGKSSGRLLPSLMSKLRPSHFFIDTDLRNTLLNRVYASLIQADEKLSSNFPESISEFNHIVPIEKPAMWMPSSTFRYPSLCLKAFNVNDSLPYILRAVKNCPVPLPNFHGLLEKLAAIQHPNLIPVRSIFTSENIGSEPCVVFVFDFIPCAATMQQRHMSDPLRLTGYASPFNMDRAARPVSAMKSAVERTMMPEAHLTAYFVQLLSALRYIHKTVGIACRYLDPTKVMITEGQRLRINCVGMADLLMPIPDSEIEMCQKKDMHILGQIMVGLACGTPVSVVEPSVVPTSVDMIRQSYSSDISSLIIQLYRNEVTNIDQAITAIAVRAFDHTATLYLSTDHLENQLAKQMECDRLFRLVCKIATVCERNELGAEAEWSDTEGRYLLKLFRDYVFHQTDQSGAPWLDLSHIVSCMNRLDMASPEKIYLVSREGQNVIIASYAELKRCLDDSYQYLMNKQIQSQQAILSDQLAKIQLEAENDGGRRN